MKLKASSNSKKSVQIIIIKWTAQYFQAAVLIIYLSMGWHHFKYFAIEIDCFPQTPKTMRFNCPNNNVMVIVNNQRNISPISRFYQIYPLNEEMSQRSYSCKKQQIWMMLFLVLDVSSVQYVWYYVAHIFISTSVSGSELSTAVASVVFFCKIYSMTR